MGEDELGIGVAEVDVEDEHRWLRGGFEAERAGRAQERHPLVWLTGWLTTPGYSLDGTTPAGRTARQKCTSAT